MWNILFQYLLMPAVLAGVLGFILKRLFTDLLSRNFEKLKLDLQKDLFKHNARFQKIYDKQNEVLLKVYKSLIIAEGESQSLTSTFQGAPQESDHEEYLLDSLSHHLRELFSEYKENQLLFPDKMKETMNSLEMQWIDLLSEWELKQFHEKREQFSDMRSKWIDANNMAKETIPKLRKILEEQVKIILGIDN